MLPIVGAADAALSARLFDETDVGMDIGEDVATYTLGTVRPLPPLVLRLGPRERPPSQSQRR